MKNNKLPVLKFNSKSLLVFENKKGNKNPGNHFNSDTTTSMITITGTSTRIFRNDIL